MMRKAFVVAAPLALMACTTVAEAPKDAELGSAAISLADGSAAGTASLIESGNHLSLVIKVAGISAGPHGVHLHTAGLCDAPQFTTAGGHLNPGAKQHGADNPMGSHLGDLPNIAVGADGTGSLTYSLHGDRAAILADIFDSDGTAIVVHAGPDDYKTDPAGNSGGRIACGVFKRG
ncbi:superoxide dismutase [Cu-Zn] [Caenibius tardaugens NBRC 16725]|uniref:Superoxide dismutase [Cu-Zn] n=1 Tax=Caenibius tardaugens NBRC 16725 TaxID=1219035 RepID=U2YL42_9SPHN|nr:superoxide dismutase family protein [Caenibius tardaugens]AZI36450.1 superoxide dismutase family protein [Caenibius tardaugens NBRC 16725]GAD49082.1 superoxide dismutase [Cu-Zn] [Caenibius tardaugens NBRC 16725]